MRFDPAKPCLGLLAATLVTSGVLLCSTPAAADVDVGLRGGYYTDAGEPFLGADVLIQIQDTRWFFNPNLEYVFVQHGDLETLNLDVHYDLDTHDKDFYVWLGGGPAILFRDESGPHGDNQTDLGFDLLGGVGWQLKSLVPYLQAKAIISDESEVVLAVGVRF
jgi:hypothetical protein